MSSISHSPWNIWGLTERVRVRFKERKKWKLRQRIVRNLLTDGFDVELHPNPWRINATRDGSEFDMDVEEDGNFPISPLLRTEKGTYYAANALWQSLIIASVNRAKRKCGIRGCWVGDHELKPDGRWGPYRCANCGTTELRERENMRNQDDELPLCENEKHAWIGNQTAKGRLEWLIHVCENGAWHDTHEGTPNDLIEGTVACTVLGLMRDYKRMEMFLENQPCKKCNLGGHPNKNCEDCGGSGKAIDVLKRRLEGV